MQHSFREKNWKDYAILVHALKSSSRMIGAESLAKAAEALEKAAKKDDAGYILPHHPDAMAQYLRVSEAAARVSPPAAEAEVTAKVPVESPAESPVESPVESPAEVPSGIPAEVQAEVPAEAPAEAPAKTEEEPEILEFPPLP